MTDVTFNISANADDGNTQFSGGTIQQFNYAYFGNRFSLSYRAFFRFQNVTIPEGVTIDSAKIRLTSDGNYSDTTCNAIVHFEDEDDPPVPSVIADVQGASLTTGTAWSSIGSWTTNTAYDSPDISSDLQEVVDRPGWASGQAVIVHILDNSSDSGVYRQAACLEHGSYDEAELIVSYSGVGISDAFGISDEVDAFNLTDSLSDGFGISDQVDAQLMAGPLADSFGISDEVDAGYEFLRDFADSFGISDTVEGFLETPKDFSDTVGFTDEVDAFHYSAWLRENRTRAKQRFFFTLTGAADSTTDIEIPASSIYARKRSGDPTYLQVAIPSFNYAAQISTRSNGTMIVEIAYVVNGEISLRETILEAELEDISTYEGANSRSIILSGHKTVTYGSQLISIDKSFMSYRGYQSKSRNLRFAIIDAYLNPSDTLVSGDDTLTVGNIVYIINSESTSMEVSEAS